MNYFLQYVRAADAGGQPTEDTIFRLPADYALKTADVYSRWSKLYAQHEDVFVRDFQRTYQRVMQVSWLNRWWHCSVVCLLVNQ